MKAVWPSKPLEELLTFLTSGSRGWAKHYRASGALFLRIQNVGKNKILLDDVAFVAPPDTQEAKRTLVQPGDVLLSITADLGRTAVVPAGLGTAFINQHLAILRVRNVDPYFLSAYLASPEGQKQVMGRNRQAVKAGLNFDDIRSFEIPLPPLAEQKRIAGILDAADALRAKRRESLAQLDSFLQSTFLTLFGDPVSNPMGWEVVTIGDLLSSTAYGTSKKAHSEGRGLPCLRMNNITYSGGWDFSSLKYVDLEAKEIPKCTVAKGQILFNRTNSKELVGKTAVYRRDEPMAFAGYLVRGIPNAEADPDYISAFLNLPQGKAILQGMCKSIVGMANINAQEFKSIQITKPPLPLQRSFAAIVESVERQKAWQRAHLAELDALFASLQHRAFRGEL